MSNYIVLIDLLLTIILSNYNMIYLTGQVTRRNFKTQKRKVISNLFPLSPNIHGCYTRGKELWDLLNKYVWQILLIKNSQTHKIWDSVARNEAVSQSHGFKPFL